MEIDFEERQTRFEEFTKELSYISKKYGVTLNVCGGVTIYNKEYLPHIVSVEYDADSSSGDLHSETISNGF